jgi:hypothetical protein
MAQGWRVEDDDQFYKDDQVNPKAAAPPQAPNYFKLDPGGLPCKKNSTIADTSSVKVGNSTAAIVLFFSLIDFASLKG